MRKFSLRQWAAATVFGLATLAALPAVTLAQNAGAMPPDTHPEHSPAGVHTAPHHPHHQPIVVHHRPSRPHRLPPPEVKHHHHPAEHP
jgi:hypothetical protein